MLEYILSGKYNRMHIYMLIQIPICVYTYIYIDMYIYICMCIYIYIQTNIHGHPGFRFLVEGMASVAALARPGRA